MSGEGALAGRYILGDEIAAGGMGAVHLGRLLGPAGFARTVAIKRLHAQHAQDPAFVAMLLDEARLAAQVRHPNVVATLDVVADEREIFLVMDYVHGESLAGLLRAVAARGERVPPAIAASIMIGVLYGLHAAHEATGEQCKPLGIVHRDVSPHNVLVGVDGVARVVDFGIAKAAARLQTTADGQIKGKLSYMSPEQLRAEHVDRRSDVFAASIVFWQLLAGRELFKGDEPGAIAASVLLADVVPPSRYAPDLPPELDAVVLRGLSREPGDRFPTARDMLLAIERALSPASPATVGDWVKGCAGAALDRRSARIGAIDAGAVTPSSASSVPGAAGPIGAAESAWRRAFDETVPGAARPKLDPSSGTGAPSASPRPAPSPEETRSALAAPIGRPTRDRRRVALVVAIGASIVVGVAFGATWHRGDRPTAEVSPRPSESLAPVPLTVGSADPPPSAPADPVAIAPTPSAPAARPSAAAPTRALSPAAAPRKRPPPATAACDPPYTWDPARQIRVYKKECR